jgi:hypothetical protein
MPEASVVEAWVERELEAKNLISKLARLNALNGNNPRVALALARAIDRLDDAGAAFAGEKD